MIRALLGQSAIYGVTTVASRGASLLLLVVLPLFLSPADYGVLSLIMAISSFMVLVAPLEVTQGLLRYFPTASEADKPQYTTAAFLFTIAGFAVFSAVALAAASPLNRILFGDEAYAPVFRLGVLLIALNGVFYFVQNQFRWEFRPFSYATVSLTFSVLTVALAVGLAASMRQPLLGVVLAQIAAAAAAIGVAVVALRRSFAPSVSTAMLGRMLRLSLPLVPASAALFVSNYASRFILNDAASLDDVGRFTYASQIAAVSMLVIVGFQGAVTPMIMKHYGDERTPPTLGRLIEVVAVLGLGLSLVLGLFAPEFIDWLKPVGYEAAAPLVILLAPALLISQLYFFEPGFLIAKRTLWQMSVSIAGAVVCIVANYALIPTFGATGAAWATLLASVVFMAAWHAASQRFYRIPLAWCRLCLLYVLAIGASLWVIGQSFASDVETILIKLAVLALALAGAAAMRLLPIREGFRLLRSAGPTTSG